MTAQRKPTIWVHLLIVLYAIVVGWAIYQYVILPSGHFHWDQAGRAARGVLIARDIQQGDWLSFLYDTYRQVYWPPVYTVLLGGAFWLGGESPLIGRLLTLGMFVIGALLLYATGLKLANVHKTRVALVAAVLFLSSPALVPFAAQVMLEVPALLFLNLTLLCFVHAEDDGPVWRHILLGLCVVGAFLTKINYGILLLTVLGLERLLSSRLRLAALFSRQNIALALALLVSFATWFAYPPKIIRTWEALLNVPAGPQGLFTPEALLYYPRGFVQIVDDPFMLGVLIVGFLAALLRLNDKNIRFLVLIVLIQALFCQLHQTKGFYRHLFPLFPPLFLCVGYFLAHPPAFIGKRVGTVAAAGLTIFILLWSPKGFIGVLRPISTDFDSTLLTDIATTITAYDAPVLIGTLNLTQPTPTLLDWSLITEAKILPATHSDVVMNYDQDAKIADLIARLGLPPALSNGLNTVANRSQAPSTVWSIYLGHSNSSYSQSPQNLTNFLLKAQSAGLFQTVIVVMPIDVSRGFIPLGGVPYTLDYILPAINALGMQNVASRAYESHNTRIEIYQ